MLRSIRDIIFNIAVVFTAAAVIWVFMTLFLALCCLSPRERPKMCETPHTRMGMIIMPAVCWLTETVERSP